MNKYQNQISPIISYLPDAAQAETNFVVAGRKRYLLLGIFCIICSHQIQYINTVTTELHQIRRYDKLEHLDKTMLDS